MKLLLRSLLMLALLSAAAARADSFGSSISMRYLNLTSPPVPALFEAANLPPPARGNVVLGANVFYMTDLGWTFGVGLRYLMGKHAEENDNRASFDGIYTGFDFGKDIVSWNLLNLNLGSFVGVGYGQLSARSGSGVDTAITQIFWVLEPQLACDFTVGTYARLGITLAYLATLDQRTREVGNQLGLETLVQGGVSVGLRLRFAAFKK